MAVGVKTVWNPAALAALAADGQLLPGLMAIGGSVAEQARVAAPKRSGVGAESIHAEPAFEDGHWTVRVSWDRDHYYLKFHELGTVHLPARPFLVPALNRYR